MRNKFGTKLAGKSAKRNFFAELEGPKKEEVKKAKPASKAPHSLDNYVGLKSQRIMGQDILIKYGEETTIVGYLDHDDEFKKVWTDLPRGEAKAAARSLAWYMKTRGKPPVSKS